MPAIELLEHVSLKLACMYVFCEPCSVYLTGKYSAASYQVLTKTCEYTEPHKVQCITLNYMYESMYILVLSDSKILLSQ